MRAESFGAGGILAGALAVIRLLSAGVLHRGYQKDPAREDCCERENLAKGGSP